MHPDQHALVVSPNNPGLFFEGSDGGLVRSSGSFADISSQCTTYRGLSGADLTLCQQLLSRVPTLIYSLNKGLSTLQFQSLSVAADNPDAPAGRHAGQRHLPSTYGSAVSFGRRSSTATAASRASAPTTRPCGFNSFTGQASDVNFRNGDPSKWVIATGPIVASAESSQFYPPAIADPNPSRGGHNLPGLEQCLAHPGLGRRPDLPGDELP